jgi:serine/threonine-protein kinase
MLEKVLKNRGYTLLCWVVRDENYGVGVVTGRSDYVTGQPVKYICKWGDENGRLSREAGYVKKVTHPLFPQWHEDWREDGRVYLIMEYISGATLEELLKRRGSMSLWDALGISMELGLGLIALHDHKPPILYRDLKPSNVMIQDTGVVRLIDMGTADERPTVMAGTPGYTAPEILGGKFAGNDAGGDFTGGAYTVGDFTGVGALQDTLATIIEQTPACDIYSMGVLLHTMLTGHNPARPPYGIEPLGVYGLRRLEAIDQIIAGCIHPDPRERISGMRELVRQISAFRPASRFSFRKNRDIIQYQKNIWLTTYRQV